MPWEGPILNVSARWKSLVVGLFSLVVVLQAGLAQGGGIGPGPGPGVIGFDIEKLVNGQDADSAPGVSVPVGSLVTFTYLVTATAPAPFGFVVRDDNGTPGSDLDDFAPGFTGGDGNTIGLLEPGETWTYTATETALAGLHTNIGAVGAIIGDFFGSPFFLTFDADPASYTGVPSPGSAVLLGLALSGLAVLRRSRSRTRTL